MGCITYGCHVYSESKKTGKGCLEIIETDYKKCCASSQGASKLSAEDKAGFEQALAELEAQLNNTVVDTDAFNAAQDKVWAYRDKINGVSSEKSFSDKAKDKANDALADAMERLSVFLYRILGGKGFSDIFRIF